jgi:hypothetical protein
LVPPHRRRFVGRRRFVRRPDQYVRPTSTLPRASAVTSVVSGLSAVTSAIPGLFAVTTMVPGPRSAGPVNGRPVGAVAGALSGLAGAFGGAQLSPRQP